jgi:hypothetical protein
MISNETLVILHETHREHWDCTGKMDILESSELFLGVYGLIFEQFPSEKKAPPEVAFLIHLLLRAKDFRQDAEEQPGSQMVELAIGVGRSLELPCLGL